ncbi:hypothetical protein ILYODFUR_038350 [Ilyodon furcidens]|uniref:Uncharacterized protein n=1 Tax=Ilyodon furcidens TaxID=33524 RepID=A0ABV0VAF9_9TELE
MSQFNALRPIQFSRHSFRIGAATTAVTQCLSLSRSPAIMSLVFFILLFLCSPRFPLRSICSMFYQLSGKSSQQFLVVVGLYPSLALFNRHVTVLQVSSPQHLPVLSNFLPHSSSPMFSKSTSICFVLP